MNRKLWPSVSESAWRWIKKIGMGRPLAVWLGYMPDPRSERKKKHNHVEILICIIIGFLNGKTTLRRIRRWCGKHLYDLRRYHWAVENSLHYVLDNSFGEDRCTVRNGKNALAVLRKFAYNIIRLLQLHELKHLKFVGDVIDDLQDDFDLIAQYIFKSIPSFIVCDEHSEDENAA